MEKTTTFKVTNLQTNEVITREMYLCEFSDPRTTPVWLARLYLKAYDRGFVENHKIRLERIN